MMDIEPLSVREMMAFPEKIALTCIDTKIGEECEQFAAERTEGILALVHV